MSAQRLADALRKIVESLSEHDDEGMLEHAEQIIEARAALAAHDSDAAGGKGVPDGWQLVPKVPTEAMIEAGYFSLGCVAAYKDMLSAAPSPQESK